MHAKQRIIIFHIFFFYYLLYVFGIVLNCFMQNNITVYPDNMFLYNYLWQMYQIIHLSLEDCLSSARGKRVQKNSAVKRTSCNVVQLHCTRALEAIYRYIIYIFRLFIIDFIVLYQPFYHKNMYAHQYNISTKWKVLKYAYDFPKCTYMLCLS